MAITPISGTDTVSFINDPVGNKANALVVIPVNPDGTPQGGTGTSSSQVQGNTASGATDAGNPVKIGGVANSAPATVTAGQRVDGWYSINGAAVVAGVTATGADAIANSSLVGLPHAGTSSARYLIVAPSVFNGATWDRQKKPSTTSRLVSAAASTNATSVKASAGDVFRVTGFNANAAARYLKLYNLAVAPTVGTSTPVWTEYLAPQAKFIIDFPTPLYFGTGISYALTTGSADSDTGALTAGDVLALNIAYQ